MRIFEDGSADHMFIPQADPYMLKGEDGRYYLYVTGGQMFSSEKLKTGWKYEGKCLDMPGQSSCWAPSVIRIGRYYYMYYSSLKAGEKNEHMQTMRVARAESPGGLFVYQKDIIPPFSIDPHVVRTPAGLYIFYCTNQYEGERPGTVVMCDKMTDPYKLEGKPKCVIHATIDQEIYKRNRFRNGEHWHTIEGPFYFYYDHMHYLMYSGACYQNDTYFIGYCTAPGEENDDLRDLEWEKYPDCNTYHPLLKKNARIEGMGHNSVIFDENKCYIVYHGRDKNERRKGPDMRAAWLDEMKINGKRLEVKSEP